MKIEIDNIYHMLSTVERSVKDLASRQQPDNITSKKITQLISKIGLCKQAVATLQFTVTKDACDIPLLVTMITITMSALRKSMYELEKIKKGIS